MELKGVSCRTTTTDVPSLWMLIRSHFSITCPPFSCRRLQSIQRSSVSGAFSPASLLKLKTETFVVDEDDGEAGAAAANGPSEARWRSRMLLAEFDFSSGRRQGFDFVWLQTTSIGRCRRERRRSW
ncbi:ABC transporter [Striga asiatica]|uniref:ABC transporter n=1 Tax=Striga asiatica TaxID=4170 RepID=A0A5A7PRI1_STRAF|nr:ABC transporter [Striga asiatica]